MGKAKDFQKPPAGVYCDEPDRDDAASTSSAVPLRDQEPRDLRISELDDELPPAYSDYTIQDDGRRDSLDHLPQEVLVKYSSQSQKDGKGSKSRMMSSQLTSDPEALRDYMLFQSRLEPRPWVRMLGTHTETRRDNKKEEKVKVTDFDIKVSLSGILMPSRRKTTIVENGNKTYRGGRVKVVAPGFKADVEASYDPPQLEEWYHRFCASSTSVKTFTITRRIKDLDQHYLFGALNDLLRTTNYRGHLSITFPIDDRATTVMSDHFINRYRYNPYVWWICVILQLWIITWPVIWLMTKRWEVISSCWHCGPPPLNWSSEDYEDPGWIVIQDNALSGIERQSRESEAVPQRSIWQVNRSNRVAVTAPQWFDAWRQAIVTAAEARKQQILTSADRDAAQAVESRILQRERERSSDDNQGGFVGAATGLIRGVSEVLRDAAMARGWGGDT